jgi:Na+/alanine symporter
MAIPNLIALLLLSPMVFKLTKDFFASGMVESPIEPTSGD